MNKAFLVLFLVVLTPAYVYAIDGMPGVVIGLVSDAVTGVQIHGATVRVYNEDVSKTTTTRRQRYVKADSQGYYEGYYAVEMPPGTYQVTVSASGYLSQTKTVTLGDGEFTHLYPALVPEVAPGNEQPTATINTPSNGAVYNLGDEISFEGTGIDVDGTIASYTWISSIDGAIGTGSSFSTTQLTAGVHTITLTVTDNDGASATAQITIRINAPPKASINSPSDGTVFNLEDEVSFDGVGIDTDGTITAYTWTSSIDGAIGTDSSFSTSQLSVGIHTITLTVTDNDGATGTTQVSIRINDPPTASILSPSDGAVNTLGFRTGDTYHKLGNSVAFNGLGTDTDGTIASYIWTSNVEGVLSSDSSFDTPDLSIGTHTITLTVTDNDGATATAQITMKINDPPTASINSPSDGAVYSQRDSTVFGGFGTDNDGFIASYTWTSNLEGTIGIGSSFSSSSLYVGVHTITLTVTDNDGATGSAQIGINQTGYDVAWRPPITKDKSFNLGSTIQIKFDVHDGATGEIVLDDTVVVRVYDPAGVEVFNAVYGKGDDSVHIDSAEGLYITNFHSSKNAATGTYKVKVEFVSNRPNSKLETTFEIQSGRISGLIKSISRRVSWLGKIFRI